MSPTLSVCLSVNPRVDPTAGKARAEDFFK